MARKKKFICCLLGCKKFKYHSKIERECLRCGGMELLVKFYPGRDAVWLDKPFLEDWGYSYEKIVAAKRLCPCCFQPEETHTCGSC